MTSASSATVRPPRRWLRTLVITLLLIVIGLPLASLMFAWWLTGSETGTRTLASQVERYLPLVKLNGVEGTATGPLRIAEIVIDAKTQRIVLSGVEVDWDPRALLDRHLHIHRLHAANLVVESKNVESPPAPLPDTLELPITIAIDAIAIDRATITPVSLEQVAGKASYDGARFRVDLAQGALRTSGATPIEARLSGTATLGATRPFAVQGDIDAVTKASVDARAIGADGKLRVSGTLEELTTQADLNLREAKATAHADGTLVVRPFADTPLASLALKLQGIDLSAIDDRLPKTRIDADVDLSSLDAGNVAIVNREPGPHDRNLLPVRTLSARINRSDGGFRFEHIVATLGRAVASAAGSTAGRVAGRESGGRITGSARVAGAAVALDLALLDVDLSQLDTHLRPTHLNGRAKVAYANGRQEFSVALTEPVKQRQLSVDAHGTLANELLTLDRAEITMGRSTVSAKAKVALDGAQSFSVEGRVRNFRLRDVATIAKAPDVLLNGDFTASGSRSPALSVEAVFSIRDSQLAGHPLTGDGRVALRGPSLDVTQLTLQSGVNKIDVKGSLSSLGERGSQLNFAVVAPSIDQLGAGYKGSVEATGVARGTWREPKISVDWKIASLVAPGGIAVDASAGHADVTIDRRQPFSLGEVAANLTANGLVTVVARARTLEGRVRYAVSGSASNASNTSNTSNTSNATNLSLNIAGTNIEAAGRKLDSARLVIDGTPQRHVIDAEISERDQRIAVHATGAVDDLIKPTRWEGTLERFEATGSVDAKLAGDAAISVSKTRVAIAHLKLLSNGATIDVERFDKEADRIVTRGRIDRLEIAKVIALARASVPIETDLIVDGRWDVTVGSTWAGNIVLDRRSGDVRVGARAFASESGRAEGSALTGQIGLGLTTLHADANASNGRLQLRVRAEGARLGRIEFDGDTATPSGAGRFAIAGNAPISGRAIIDVPSIAWVGPLASPNLIVAGQLKGDVALKGTIGNPELDGRINGNGLRVTLADPGIDLRQGVLEATFSGTRLSLERLEFTSANDGTVKVAGPIDFAGGTPSFDLVLDAKRYQLLNRGDRKLVISGDSRVRVAEKRLRVTGAFDVDSGFFDIGRTGAPTLSDDVVIVGRQKKGDSPMAVALDVRVRLGDGITLTGRGIDALLKGEIRLVNDAGQLLQAQGTFNVDKGTYTAYGQKLAIEQGLLRFTGAINNPQLSILAMRRDRTQEVDAGVSVRGTVQTPRITLVSEPNVPDAEKLAWLVLGRSLSNAGTGDADALQRAAGLLLTNSAANGVSSQIATAFGLDTLSVGTSKDTVAQRIVTVGKRISSRLYVSYQKGLETASNALLLRYTLSPRLTVEAETGTRSALSLFYNIAFD